MTLPARIGLDELLFLERHETRVHALPRRLARDLGDAWLLYDEQDRDPFWNRVAAICWPDAAAAFDRRVAETIALFATLDRIPHVWPRPALNRPDDLVDRLLSNGWQDAGGGHLMVLGDPAPAGSAAGEPVAPGVTVERLHRPDAAEARRFAADVALVLTESFEADLDRAAAIEHDTLALSARPEVHLCLVRVDGQPAAVAKRTTLDGATYLSSIGTRPAFRGRGLARLATAAVTADAVAEGSRHVYLGVWAGNDPAIRLYRGLGFEAVGGVAPDLLLR